MRKSIKNSKLLGLDNMMFGPTFSSLSEGLLNELVPFDARALPSSIDEDREQDVELSEDCSYDIFDEGDI